MTMARIEITLYPIVRDALDLLRKTREAKTVDTRTTARRRLLATLNAMTAPAQRQFYEVTAACTGATNGDSKCAKPN